MIHLKIEQDGITEEVTSSVISKLYEIASTSTLDNTSNLKGRLHSVVARDAHVTYLNTNYPDLHISADKLYITFEDAEVDRILTQKFGDGVGVTDIDMLSVTNITDATGFANNTTVQTFNELGRFSTIKRLYTFAFNQCTNLTSIDLSNIEHVGGEALRGTNLTGVINLPNVISIGDSARAESFGYCENITEINIGSSFNSDTTYMRYAFNGCTNLEKVTGLNNITEIPNYMFQGCNKLSQVDIDWTKIVSIGHRTFYRCGENLSLLPSTITTPSTCFGMQCFDQNKDVQKIVLTGEDIQIYNWAFANCSNLTEIENSNKITKIGSGSFAGCGITVLDLSGVTDWVAGYIDNIGQGGFENVIYNCPNLQKIVLGTIPALGASPYSVSRSTIYSCPMLTTVDISEVSNIIVTNNPLFWGCDSLQALILRCNTVPTMTIQNIASISKVQFFNGSADAYVYVPDNMVNSYKTSSGWSDISDRIKGISELPS